MDERWNVADVRSIQQSPRVNVVGSSCAGKSTFARRLAEALGAPCVELDALHWLADWQERPLEDFRSLVDQAAAGPSWVVEGNYRMVRDLIWPRATAIIWLNYSFPTVWSRALRRSIRRLVTNEELFSSNRESWRMTFCSRDSILWWVLSTFRRRRREFQAIFDAPPTPGLPRRIEFRHPRETEQFLQSLARSDIDMTVERTAAD